LKGIAAIKGEEIFWIPRSSNLKVIYDRGMTIGRDNSKAMKSFLNIAVNLIAFGLTSYLAVTQQWSVQEFCWSVWLAGLFLFMDLCHYGSHSNSAYCQNTKRIL